MALQWFDTHCHLDAGEFAADRAEVRSRATLAGVTRLLIPAVRRDAFDGVRALAHAGDDRYALGIHPMYTPGAGDDDLDALRAALAAWRGDPRLVAVGEIGLDLFVPGLREGEPLRRQHRFYREQLRMAREFDLPVILHVRRSADLLLSHLRELPVRGGIAHAFNGSAQQAAEFVRLGFKLGFGGAATFERANQLRRLATELPLEALVVETDAPDIPPQWLYRPAGERAGGAPQGRNEPAELPRIAAAIARLRGISAAELAWRTWVNASAVLGD